MSQTGDICAGSHSINHCPINSESVQYITNYNQQQGNNTSYHPRVRTQQNSWSDNNQAQYFAPRLQYSPGVQNQPPPYSETKSNLEELLTKAIERMERRMNNQEASLRNLENQVGQLINANNGRLRGTLPSNTTYNPSAMP